MLSRETRRKVAVHVTGASDKSAEGAAKPVTCDADAVPAADAMQAKTKPAGNVAAAEQNGTAQSQPDAQLIKDIWVFKGLQTLYPAII